MQVIHENLKIERGMITTIHNVTGTQTLVRPPTKHRKPSRAHHQHPRLPPFAFNSYRRDHSLLRAHGFAAMVARRWT